MTGAAALIEQIVSSGLLTNAIRDHFLNAPKDYLIGLLRDPKDAVAFIRLTNPDLYERFGEKLVATHIDYQLRIHPFPVSWRLCALLPKPQ